MHFNVPIRCQVRFKEIHHVRLPEDSGLLWTPFSPLQTAALKKSNTSLVFN